MSVIWCNKPKKLFIIETDQKRIKVIQESLDYKKTIQNLKQAGYTNIHINCIGRVYNY